MHAVIEFFSNFPPELATFILSMMPLGELRLSLPVGIIIYNLPVWKVLILSIIGNTIPAVIILLFAKKFHEFIDKKSGLFAKNWVKILHKAQNKFAGKYEKYGLIGLILFVGIPLPGTGAYTGALAAFVLGISIRKSGPYIFIGIILAAIITLIATLGINYFF